MPIGPPLAPGGACVNNTERTLVLLDTSLEVDLSALNEEIAKVEEKAVALFGLPKRRLVVGIGGTRTRHASKEVIIDTELATWAANAERIDALAALASSLVRVSFAHCYRECVEERWNTVEAMTRQLLVVPAGRMLVGVDEEAVNAILKRVREEPSPSGHVPDARASE